MHAFMVLSTLSLPGILQRSFHSSARLLCFTLATSLDTHCLACAGDAFAAASKCRGEHHGDVQVHCVGPDLRLCRLVRVGLWEDFSIIRKEERIMPLGVSY